MEILYISFMLATLIIFFKIVRTKTSNAKQLPPPPGPWKLPLAGNLHNLIGDLPHRAFHRLAEKLGPIMSFQLGEVRSVIISSADTAIEIMKNHDLNFASRSTTAVAEIFSYGCINIAFSPYGEHWRQLRKICTMELLSSKRVQLFRPMRESVFLDMCRAFAEHSMKGSAVNLSEELVSSAYALIAGAVVGEEAVKHEGLLSKVKEMPELGAGFDIAEMFPSVKLLSATSRLRRRILAVHRELDMILDEVLSQHIASKTEDQSSFLDVLLKLQEEGQLEIPLTTTHIKAVLMDMLIGGSDTSSTTLDWAMCEMMKDQRVLKKVQEEVRRVFDGQGCVDESLIPELKYMKCVVKETLRMHPPVPLLVPRKCGETCEINGYQILANTRVIINAWAINRNPKHWEDPHCFKPERFMDSLVDFRGNNFEYIPFGAGRRMCPGIGLGLVNVELPLAMFLYHFDWELDGGMKPQDLDMTEGYGNTIRRLKDLYLIPTIKRPLPTK